MSKRKLSWLKAKMPTRAEMESNRWLAPIAHRFGRSELWRFTRRSVPRGVALGLFAGFIIPIGQIFLAAFLALPLRANVPVAALMTFVTNPFTLPFWLVVANRVGRFSLMLDAMAGTSLDIHGQWWSQAGWFLETAGVTAVGFIVLAIGNAALGYLLTSLGWRWFIARKWRRRASRIASIRPAE